MVAAASTARPLRMVRAWPATQVSDLRVCHERRRELLM
jgi:hypothetical protein